MRGDVVVVGAGPAGLACATRLAEAGRQVRLIARGNGFTHWGAGSVDVLGRLGGRRVERPLDAVAELPERHPYRLMGEAALRDGLDWFRRFAAGAGLEHAGDPEVNRRQITALGTTRTACMLPAPAAGELRGRVAVVGFAGFRDFSPALCASGLRLRAADMERRCGLRLVEAALPPPSVPGLRLFSVYRERLAALGVRWQLGFPATGIEREGDRVTGVRSEGASREVVTRCDEVVLATGGVAGHGIEARRDGSLVETVAGLPVAGFPDRTRFLADRFLGDHPP